MNNPDKKLRLFTSSFPWWARICIKMILSRLPVKYGFWQHIGLFRHGYMDKSEYALGVFDRHVSRARIKEMLNGKTILEIGPGDSLCSAIIAASYGAKAILVDTGRYATSDIDIYKRLADELFAIGLTPPNLSSATSLEEILSACNALYLTNGLTSFSCVESKSVDFIFSQAVLEHIRKNEFAKTMRECRRVLAANGMASHRVDLKDHLGGGLNNLRFSDRLWESKFFAGSGFYTNRIRFPEMKTLFEASGFDVTILNVDRWATLPIRRSELDLQFSHFSDDELTPQGFDVLLRAPHRLILR